MFNEHDEDSGDNMYETDESDNDDSSHYDDFWFQNHLEDIISYNAALFFMLLFIRFSIMIEWFFKNLGVRKNLRAVTRGTHGILAAAKTELFVKLVKGFVPLTNIIKNSMLRGCWISLWWRYTVSLIRNRTRY